MSEHEHHNAEEREHHSEHEQPQPIVNEGDVIKISDEPAPIRSKEEEYKDLLQRVQADFDNYRKRTHDAVKAGKSDAIDDTLKEILPVLDNMERAFGAILDVAARSGFELIYRQLVSVLEKYGVEAVGVAGEQFNPEAHHAIAQVDAPEHAGIVVEVFQKGYKRGLRILRPAMVKVAQ